MVAFLGKLWPAVKIKSNWKNVAKQQDPNGPKTRCQHSSITSQRKRGDLFVYLSQLKQIYGF